MQTRRDQLQAYRYLLRRVMAAMLGSEPEAIEQPMRRVTTSTLAGIMVGVLACAGVALYGWIGNSSATKWKTAQRALIIEKETNATYLYLPKADLAAGGKAGNGGQGSTTRSSGTGQVPEKDMVLVQILNYTSARLILGAQPTVVRVSQHSLDGIARGPRIGIPLAPSAVPSDKNIVSSPWSICSTGQPGDGASPRVDVVIGTPEKKMGAQPVGNRALLVKAGDTALTYLIWHGKRLAADSDALRSLKLSTSAAVQVGPSWLDAVEAGHPLRAPVIEHRTEPGPITVGGESTNIGQVFHTVNPDAYYVMLADGFSEITKVQANLIFGEGTARVGDQVQVEPTDVAISDVNRHVSKTAENLIEPDLPAAAPRIADLGGRTNAPMCVWYEGDDVHLTTGGTTPAGGSTDDSGNGGSGGNGGASGSGSSLGFGLADRVLVPPGKAAVVGVEPAPGVKPESYFLVTEDGVRFPIPNSDVLGRLGYSSIDPAKVPGSLLRLIPQGPALTVDGAYRAASFDPAASDNPGG